MPPLRYSLHAWIRGAAPSDPTWTELQRLTNAVRLFSQEFLVQVKMRQHVLHTPGREPLIFRLDAHRQRPYPFWVYSTLQESMATCLRTSGDDDVLLTLVLPDHNAPSIVERELVGALQQLSTDSAAESATPAARHVLPAENDASGAARRDIIVGWLTAAQAGARIPGALRGRPRNAPVGWRGGVI